MEVYFNNAIIEITLSESNSPVDSFVSTTSKIEMRSVVQTTFENGFLFFYLFFILLIFINFFI